MPQRVRLGSGRDTSPDWIDVDNVLLPSVDVVADLTHFPYPFKDSSFDELEARHILEHIPDTVRAIEEIHRIAKPAGHVYIEVPYWNSEDAFTDPTHVRFFSDKSFDYFSERGAWSSFNYITKARFVVERVDYKFTNSPWFRWMRASIKLKLARYIGNIVLAVGFHLRVVK